MGGGGGGGGGGKEISMDDKRSRLELLVVLIIG